jgi:Na+-driven multidrug efflux pump
LRIYVNRKEGFFRQKTVLMLGKLGFPALGIVGIGCASILSLWGMSLALAFFQLVDGIQVTAVGALRGIKDLTSLAAGILTLRFSKAHLWADVNSR